jgi:hypothetical protein
MLTFYGLLADGVVVIHFLYVAYVVVGQLAILAGVILKWNWIRNPWFRWSHLLMICFVAGESIVNFECPLTTWENDLRRQVWSVKNIPPRVTTWAGLLASPTGEGPFLASPMIWQMGIPAYAETFVGRLINNIMFCNCNVAHWGFKVGYISFAVLVIACLWLAPPRRRKKNRSQESGVRGQESGISDQDRGGEIRSKKSGISNLIPDSDP